jgi:hypothetical protein
MCTGTSAASREPTRNRGDTPMPRLADQPQCPLCVHAARWLPWGLSQRRLFNFRVCPERISSAMREAPAGVARLYELASSGCGGPAALSGGPMAWGKTTPAGRRLDVTEANFPITILSQATLDDAK